MAMSRRPDLRLARSVAGLMLLLCLFVSALPSAAQVPGRVNFQGLLLDSAGQPLTATVSLQLQLFSAASGGTALWTETHPSVSVSNGIYDVVLGSLTPLTPSLFSASPRYLEVTINGQILTPRREFVAVPFALKADTANTATTAGYATDAGHAATADSATTVENVGGISAEFVAQMYQNADFDNNGLLNSDPVEGLIDSDGDSTANFLDADNDADGLDDDDETAQGSDPNLVTPTLGTFSPPLLDDDSPPTAVTITGTNFDEPGLSVTFGSQTPTPTNVTATSFQVTVGPQPDGVKSVVVSLGNGESAQGSYTIQRVITAFVSSTTYDGNLGGTAGADAKCQARASAAGLSGTYIAFIRNLAGAIPSWPPTTLVFKRTDGQKIADSYADLTDTTLDLPLNRDEFGAAVGSSIAWTGTGFASGVFVGSSTCTDWSSASGSTFGSGGATANTNFSWFASGQDLCSATSRLYCFEAP